MKFIDVSALL